MNSISNSNLALSLLARLFTEAWLKANDQGATKPSIGSAETYTETINTWTEKKIWFTLWILFAGIVGLCFYHIANNSHDWLQTGAIVGLVCSVIPAIWYHECSMWGKQPSPAVRKIAKAWKKTSMIFCTSDILSLLGNRIVEGGHAEEINASNGYTSPFLLEALRKAFANAMISVAEQFEKDQRSTYLSSFFALQTLALQLGLNHGDFPQWDQLVGDENDLPWHEREIQSAAS